MTARFEIPGLYAITPEHPLERLPALVEAALRGGAALIQFRSKGEHPDRAAVARRLLAICLRFQRPLIVNDDVELASAIGAAGVHLGRDDLELQQARRYLGPRALIGVSCYASIPRARAAAEAGADYVAFGSVFPSTTKPDAPRVSLETLQQARRVLRIPIVAIGGITIENAEPVLTAGADLLAVVNGVFGAADPEAATREFSALARRIRSHAIRARAIDTAG